jgi:hypothetical protein
MLRLFRLKIFSKKCFRHFPVFGGGENNGQRKSFFSLTVKYFLIFGKRFTVLKTVNHFLDLNSSFLHTHLWKSATVGHWILLVTQLFRRRSPNFSIGLLKFGNLCRNLTTLLDSDPFSRIPARLVGIWKFKPESGDFAIFWYITFQPN